MDGKNRNIKLLVLLFLVQSVSVCRYLLDFRFKGYVKPVCKEDLLWRDVSQKLKEKVRSLVHETYPHAKFRLFVPSSRRIIAVDQRNQAFDEKGYFVIGFDNNGMNTPIPGGYDFYIKFSRDQEGSHFFLKAMTIRKAIETCQKQVNFVYKDNDVIVQNNIRDTAFHPYKLGYQMEFHNSSANAGVIFGKASSKVKGLIEEWEAGSGMGSNLEQDQTILRAFVRHRRSDFFPLPPNTIARHVYSVVTNRNLTIRKAQILHSKCLRYGKSLLTVFTMQIIYIITITDMDPDFIRKVIPRKCFKFAKYISFKFVSLKIILATLVLSYLDRIIRDPIYLGNSFGEPTLLDLGNYHSAFQLQSDNLARVWKCQGKFYVGNTRVTYFVPILAHISPSVVVSFLDLSFFIIILIPLYEMRIFSIALCLILALESYYNKQSHVKRKYRYKT